MREKPEHEMNIQVIRLIKASVPGQPNLRAFVEIKVGEVTICDCRIIQQPGQKAYVTGPQKQVGLTFFPLVKMTPALRDQVQGVVLSEAVRRGLVTVITPAMPDNKAHQQPDLLDALTDPSGSLPYPTPDYPYDRHRTRRFSKISR